VALATVSLLIYATVSAYARDGGVAEDPPRARSRVSDLALGTAGLTLVQIGLGTRVRSTLDTIGANPAAIARGEWIDHVGAVDHVHRAFAMGVLLAALLLAIHARRMFGVRRVVRAWCDGVAALALAQVLVGVGLAYRALPPVLQVLHVTIASLMLGALVVVAMVARQHVDEDAKHEPAGDDAGVRAQRAV
jgi:cytochrome c oxidase assembly protein subunit 15